MMKKKILAGSLVFFMLAGLINVSAEEETQLTDFYASRNNVYLTFSENPSVDTEVTIKNADGEDVSFSKNIQEGNVLRLTLSEKLELGECYLVEVGDEAKAFKVKELLFEDFSDEVYKDSLDFYKVGSTAANQARVGFLDGKLFMQQRYVSYFTLKDGLVNNLKNYTVEFDMETYVAHMAGIMFNKTNKKGQFRYGTKTEGVDEIGWTFGTQNDWVSGLFRYERTDAAQTPTIKGSNSGSYTMVTDKILPSTYKITYDDATGIIGLDTTTATRLPQSNTYTVDKMGRTGVLSLDDVVKDVYSSETTAETGYFFIGSTDSWNMNNTTDGRGISLDNISVTVCDDEIDIGDINLVDSSVSKEYFTFEFDREIDEVTDDNIEENISLSDGSENVLFEYEKEGKVLKIIPQNGVLADVLYNITIKPGFGYDMVLFGVEETKTLLREAETGVITLDAADYVEGKIVLSFNRDIEEVKNPENSITLSNNGEALNYEIEAKENKIFLSLSDGFTPDEEYSISVPAGFGYEKVLTEEEFLKTVKIDVATIKLSEVYAGENNLYLTFDTDLSDVSEYAVKENIKVLSYAGEEMEYSPLINGNKITLKLSKKMIFDKVYDLVIDKGFGVKYVKETKEDVHKYFELKTVNELDFSGTDKKGEDYFTVASNTTNGKFRSVITIKDGKAYFRTCRYGALIFNKQGLENMENYSISFKLENHNLNDGQDGWEVRLPILFNRNNATFSIHLGNASRQEGYGWNVDGSGYIRNYVLAIPSGGEAYQKIYENGMGNKIVSELARQNADLQFVNDADDTEIKVGNSVSASVNIDKMGYVGVLSVDGEEVNTLDTMAISEDLTNTLKKEWIPSNKGYFVLGGASGGGAFSISNVRIYQFNEVNDRGIEIIEENITDENGVVIDDIKNKEKFSINTMVRNYKGQAEAISVIAAVYGENGQLIKALKQNPGEIKPGEIKKLGFGFENISGADKFQVVLVDSNMLLPHSQVSEATVVNTDKEKNILTVNAKVKPSENDRNIIFFLLKDGITKEWNEIKSGDGIFKAVEIKKGEELISFNMNYVIPDDYTGGFIVNNLYSMDAAPLASFKYIKDENAISDIKNAVSDFNGFSEYAPSIGVDLSYIENENQKNYFWNELEKEKADFENIDDIKEASEEIKVKIQMASALKNDTASYSDVNNLLKKYEPLTDIDLTEYSKLSDAKKIEVCKKFVRADYEKEGIEGFIADFNEAVKEAGKSTTSNKGNSGGSGGGGYSANVIPRQEIPNALKGADLKDNDVTKEVVFDDLTAYEWASEAVLYLAKNNILNGVGEKKFAPGNVITREQLAKIIVLAFGLYNDTARSEFTDVEGSSWSYGYIASAVDSGIMKGVGNGEFAPQKEVTRQDLATVLYRVSMLKGKEYSENKTDFADFENISEYAKEAVGFMAGEKIINGFSDGTFRPKDSATRAQAAQLIYLIMKGMN